MWRLMVVALLLGGCAGDSGDRVGGPGPAIGFEALARDGWTDGEQANVALVSEFVQAVMNDHDFDRVLERFANDAYVQHNRNLPNGIDGLVRFLEEFVNDYPEYSYDVKHVYADGEYVVFHSHATLKAEHRGDDGMGMNIIDVWRVEEGRIVEHWDAIQPLDRSMRMFALLSGGKVRNENGVF